MGGNFGQNMTGNGEIIQDYNNDKVQQIRMELGEFEYDEQSNQTRGMDLDYRPMQTLDNHARYEGEW